MTVGELKWIIEVLPDEAEVAIHGCLVGHDEEIVMCAKYREVDRGPEYYQFGQRKGGKLGRLTLYDIPDPNV